MVSLLFRFLVSDSFPSFDLSDGTQTELFLDCIPDSLEAF